MVNQVTSTGSQDDLLAKEGNIFTLQSVQWQLNGRNNLLFLSDPCNGKTSQVDPDAPITELALTPKQVDSVINFKI